MNLQTGGNKMFTNQKNNILLKGLLLMLYFACSHSLAYDFECCSCETPCCCLSGCLNQCQQFPLWGKTFFLPRSQGLDAARDITGVHRFLHQYDKEGFYGTFSITPQYSHSFKDVDIARYFFGQNCFNVSGSRVESRPNDSLLADYFGLSPTYDSRIELHPSIANFITDFSLYGQWNCFYAALHVPLVYTKWKFGINERVCNCCPCIPFPERYMSEDEVIPPYSSFRQAWQAGKSFGDVHQGLCCGKWCCPQTKWGVADVHVSAGWDFILRDHGNAGFYFQLVIPTGNKPNTSYIFSPIVGNGHHWECGVGFNGRILTWECSDEQKLSFHFDGKVTHLFSSCQCRSFDFCPNCFASRYMLLKEFCDGCYTRNLTPAINITTLPVDVSIAAQFDLVAMLSYLNKGFEFDVGYNAWVRTEEKLELAGCIPDNRYGFKGIQNVVLEDGTPSVATESTATIHGSFLSQENQDRLVDNSSPVYIKTCDLNLSSGAAGQALTHKLFIYLGYACNTWGCAAQEEWYKPFIGAGGSVEFQGMYPEYSRPYDNSMSQYSIWIKGGVSF